MIERIEGMPLGTVGLQASGKLSREDYREVLEPVLQEAVGSGELAWCSPLPTSKALIPR